MAWSLLHSASILFPTFEAPTWVMKMFVTAVILGFRVALIMDVRTDTVAEFEFGKTVQPSFISFVNIFASSAAP